MEEEMTVWESRCRDLGDALIEACAGVLPDAETRCEDRSVNMLAIEGHPTVVPYQPIGTIYQYHLQERSVRHLFGWKRLPYRRWRTAVSFGMEEMWNAPRWPELRGFWCHVRDARFGVPAHEITSRFAETHRLKFRFSRT
jgi:hypothetical protein